MQKLETMEWPLSKTLKYEEKYIILATVTFFTQDPIKS